MKRQHSKLTEIQTKFVEGKLEGLSDNAAARAAGSKGSGGGCQIARSESVRAELQAARRWLTDTTQIKRLDVIEGIIDSIEMGRMVADPAAVRQGWVEIGKILGHYAPEVKRIELSMAQGRLKSKFESLPDEELLAMQEGAVVDGDFTEVH